MLLYANGCSMTYGAELAEDPETRECTDDEYRESHAWPGVLAGELGWDHRNAAFGGSSNDRILRTTLADVTSLLETQSPSELYVIVGWSSPDRREFFSNFKNSVGHNPWTQLMPQVTPANEKYDKAMHDVYYTHFFHPTESVWRFLTQVVSLQSFLVSKGIKHLFFSSIFTHIFQDIIDAGAVTLAGEVDWARYYGFGHGNQHMHHYLRVERRLEMNPGQHPKEDGHVEWAKFLRQYMRNL